MMNNFRNIRKKRNVSIAEMSKVLGFKSKSTYCKKELGYVPI